MKIAGIIFASLVVVILALGFWFNGVVSASANTPAGDYTLTIQAGTGVKAVAEDLLAAGYIEQRWHWNAYIWLSGLRSRLLPGVYVIQPSMSIREIARVVTTPPDRADEAEVKLLEGWTAREMAEALASARVVDANEFVEAVANPDASVINTNTYPFLNDKPAGASLEGYLFPDTYRFFLDSDPNEVLKKMLDNFSVKFSGDLRLKLQQQKRSVFETIVLASIVEKELDTDRDRAMAADLFLRRMEIGMALQSDATVNYVTGKNSLQPTFADIGVDSQYNTYKYRGLPPGPICNPSLSSLRATVTPEPNDYLFFLTELDSKKVHFSKTLEEHNQKKAQYLR